MLYSVITHRRDVHTMWVKVGVQIQKILSKVIKIVKLLYSDHLCVCRKLYHLRRFKGNDSVIVCDTKEVSVL